MTAVVIVPEMVALLEPLSLKAKVVGAILAIVVASSGVVFLVRQRSSANELAGNRWRLPTSLIMIACGVLFFAGLWVDPREQPRLFIYVWSSTLLLAAAVALLGGVDLLFIRRRALDEQIRMARSNPPDREKRAGGLQWPWRPPRNGSH